MRIYLFKRVLYSLLVMWGVATLVFFMLRAIPGDPVSVILGEEATPEATEQLRRNLGLDGPLYVQYGRWFARLLQGDLGRSILAGEQVTVLLRQAAPRAQATRTARSTPNTTASTTASTTAIRRAIITRSTGRSGTHAAGTLPSGTSGRSRRLF